jgi:septum formation topological specificity factor MinE
MQITNADSQTDIAEMYSYLFGDVIRIYNDPNYMLHSRIETFMIANVLALSHYAIKNRWSQFQDTLCEYLLDDDDDDDDQKDEESDQKDDDQKDEESDQKDEESAQTVSETTYEMWLQDPFKFNDICVTLFKKIVESTKIRSEKFDALNSKCDQIISLLETYHSQKIAEAVVNMFPTDEVDDENARERLQIVIADDLAKNPKSKPRSPEMSQNILEKALVILKDIRSKRSIMERMENLQQRIDNFQNRLDANASTPPNLSHPQDQQQYPYVVIEINPDHDPSSSTPVDVQDTPVVSLEKVPVDVQDTSVASLESLPSADDRLKSNMLDIVEKLDNYLKTHGIPDEFDPDEKYQAPEIPDEFDPDAEQRAKNSVRQFIQKTKEVYGENCLTKTKGVENVPPPPNSTPDDTDSDESSSVTPVMSDVPQPNPRPYVAKSAIDSFMEIVNKFKRR